VHKLFSVGYVFDVFNMTLFGYVFNMFLSSSLDLSTSSYVDFAVLVDLCDSLDMFVHEITCLIVSNNSILMFTLSKMPISNRLSSLSS